MKILSFIFIFCLVLVSGFLFGQHCITIAESPVPACVYKSESQKSTLKSLRKAPAGSISHLFYDYFTGTDYVSYKGLFAPADWYDLTVNDFNIWRSFIKNANLNILGIVELNAKGMELGIIKYTYIIDDELLYETFLAKKTGTQWWPVSVKEENDLISIAGIIKNINLGYLASLISSGRQNDSQANDSKVEIISRMHSDKLLDAKESDGTFSVSDFRQYYNNDFEYRSNKKFNEDRANDSKFIDYLKEMNLTQDQIAVVMRYITIHDYLRAADKADKYSEASYTYAPFVDKIREVYGRDRIRKWDQTNKKWD